jgi:hypothetical protein
MLDCSKHISSVRRNAGFVREARLAEAIRTRIGWRSKMKITVSRECGGCRKRCRRGNALLRHPWPQ